MAEDTNAPQETAQDALARIEAQRTSRRAALAKIGMRAGAAVLAAFSIDDLARKAGAAMQAQAGNNKVANQVARELQRAGVAYAGDGGTTDPVTDPNPDPNPDPKPKPCPPCDKAFADCKTQCIRLYGPHPSGCGPAQYSMCIRGCDDFLRVCKSLNNCPA